MALIIDNLKITNSAVSVDIKDSTKYGKKGTLKLYIGGKLVQQKEIVVNKNFKTEEFSYQRDNSFTVRVSTIYGDQKAEIKNADFT